MPPDCFALSGLTDCAASTPQGVAWAGLFQPFGLKSRQCYSPLHDSVLKFVRLGARCARPTTLRHLIPNPNPNPQPQSPIPNPQSPIPNPQSLIPNPQSLIPNP